MIRRLRGLVNQLRERGGRPTQFDITVLPDLEELGDRLTLDGVVNRPGDQEGGDPDVSWRVAHGWGGRGQNLQHRR